MGGASGKSTARKATVIKGSGMAQWLYSYSDRCSACTPGFYWKLSSCMCIYGAQTSWSALVEYFDTGERRSFGWVCFWNLFGPREKGLLARIFFPERMLVGKFGKMAARAVSAKAKALVIAYRGHLTGSTSMKTSILSPTISVNLRADNWGDIVFVGNAGGNDNWKFC